MRPHVLVTVFLGFTKDPYPCVREAALDGLVNLSKSSAFEDRGLVEGCYYRALELLGDVEACVRCAAIRTVCDWGHILVAFMQGTEKKEQSDAIFIQLCSMVRDMSMEVRVEAFDALGKTQTVSLKNLLQSLSKKVLGSMKENRSVGQSTGPVELSASSVAGALVHGFEDEYYEVRRSVCHSMRRLCMISSEFSIGAISLLMDMLNDDSVIVRLEALETMHHMATCDHLNLEVMHMHMFLGALVDKNELVRAAIRKILKFVKLRDQELLKLSVNGLIKNLETYPQDEVDIFSVLFHVGQRHGNFVACFINEVFHEIEPSPDGKLSFDCARVAALLVLSISAPTFAEKNVGEIPQRVFSYAVTLLGRISHAVGDITSQNALFAYLSQGSSCMEDNISEFGQQILANMGKDGAASLASNQNDLDQFPLGEASSEHKKMYARKFWQPNEEPGLTAKQLQIHDDITESLNGIFTKVKAVWPLVKAGFTNEVLKILRIYEEELKTLETKCTDSPALAFTLQYMRTLKFLASVWSYFHSTIGQCCRVVSQLDILLVKLERTLRDMKCKFTGLSKEDELYLLELTSVSLTLNLSKLMTGRGYIVNLKRLAAVLLQVECLQQEHGVEPSSFVCELKKSMPDIHSAAGGMFSLPHFLRKMLDAFSLKQYELSRTLQSLSAEITVPDNDSENPIHFIHGLPVGIQLEITLCNISRENRLWLEMTMGKELKQFIFLDLKLFGGSNDLKKGTYFATYYKTPKAVSFTLRVCIGVECFPEEIYAGMPSGGPKRELTYLSPEREVYFSAKSQKLT